MTSFMDSIYAGKDRFVQDQERKRQETTRKLFGEALQNKPDALTQLYGVDPATALKAKEQTQTMQKESAQLAWQAASAMHNAAPEQKATTYASIHAEMMKHPELGAWVSQLPDQYDPATVDPIVQGIIAQTGIYQDPKADAQETWMNGGNGTMISNRGNSKPIKGYKEDPKWTLEKDAEGNPFWVNPASREMMPAVPGQAAPSSAPQAPAAGGMNIYDAVQQQESGGNPNAVSPKGARGLMQVMPATAKDPGFGITPLRDNSPQENVRLGREYIDKMIQRYGGNQKLALAAYNAGPGAVDAALQKAGNNPEKALQYLPKETQNYVPSVLGRTQSAPQSGGAAWKNKKDAKPEVDAKAEMQLRKEYQDLVNKPMVILGAAQQVQAAAKDPSAAGDIAMIFSYMRMLDPTSVVREGEFATAQNAAGIPDQIKNLWNRAQSGQRLNPAQRQDFIAQAKKLALQNGVQVKKYQKRYSDLASQYKMDPSRIVYSPYEDNVDAQGGQSDDQALLDKYLK